VTAPLGSFYLLFNRFIDFEPIFLSLSLDTLFLLEFYYDLSLLTAKPECYDVSFLGLKVDLCST